MVNKNKLFFQFNCFKVFQSNVQKETHVQHFFPFKIQFEPNMPNINPFISPGTAACSLTYNAILYSYT